MINVKFNGYQGVALYILSQSSSIITWLFIVPVLRFPALVLCRENVCVCVYKYRDTQCVYLYSIPASTSLIVLDQQILNFIAESSLYVYIHSAVNGYIAVFSPSLALHPMVAFFFLFSQSAVMRETTRGVNAKRFIGIKSSARRAAGGEREI